MVLKLPYSIIDILIIMQLSYSNNVVISIINNIQFDTPQSYNLMESGPANCLISAFGYSPILEQNRQGHKQTNALISYYCFPQILQEISTHQQQSIKLISVIQLMDWLNKVEKINNKFRFQLFGKNRENLELCYNKISQFDPESTCLMSDHAFNLFLNSFGVFLTTQEIRYIKDAFSESNKIKYFDYLQYLRSDISEKRRATIDHAFSELSSDGIINIDQLMDRFDASRHPHTRCMLRNPNQIRMEYEDAIRRRSADGRNLTQSQFVEYYLDANACIPYERQEFFVDLLINTFKLMDNRVTIDRLKQMEVTVYEKVRQKTMMKKDEGDKAKGSFRFFDMEDKGIVDYKRFVQTLQRLGCQFTQKQMKVLYQKHAGEDGILTYQEMCGLLFDMGSGKKDNKNPIFQTSKGINGTITSQGMTKKLS